MTSNTRLFWVLVGVVLFLAFVGPAMADPFAAADELGRDIQRGLTTIAVTVVAIVLTVIGFMLLKGWISPGWAASLAAGAILIGSAFPIAEMLVQR